MNIFFPSHKRLLVILKDFFSRFYKWGKQKLTVMFIPHDEKKVISFHISLFTILFTIVLLVVAFLVSSFYIMRHSSIVKEIEALNITQKESEKIIAGFKEKVHSVDKVVAGLRKDTEVLYSTVIDKKAPFLWAKGGEGIIIPDELKGEVSKKDIPIEIYELLDRVRELGVVNEVLDRVKKFLLLRKPIIQNMPSIWPVYGQIVRVLPVGSGRISIGVDIETLPGLGVRATAPGKVSMVGWRENDGITVEIEHKYGFRTVYSHLLSANVSEGQVVKKGDIIGYVGNTGMVHNYICHYEIYIGLYPVNPIPYLNKID